MSHNIEHVTFVSTEQTGSFWTAEPCDMWLLDCSAWGFLSTWQVRTKRVKNKILILEDYGFCCPIWHVCIFCMFSLCVKLL